MDDQYTGIFDHLEPDDFRHDTSSASTAPTNTADFEAFVQAGILALRTNFATMDKINPFYIVENGNVQRIFTASGTELLGEFIERVRNETRVISAHWFFFAQETSIGIVRDHEPIEAADSKEALENADPESWGRRVFFLAADRKNEVRQFGVFDIIDDALAAEPTLYEQDLPVVNLFNPHHAE